MIRIILFLGFCIIATTGFSQPTLNFTALSLSGPALVQPVDITGCGDASGRLFIVEKSGISVYHSFVERVLGNDFFKVFIVVYDMVCIITHISIHKNIVNRKKIKSQHLLTTASEHFNIIILVTTAHSSVYTKK